MNDLNILFSIIIVVSIIFYFLSFGLWWMILLIGSGFYLLLRLLTGLRNDSEDFDEDISGVVPNSLKRLIVKYLDRNGVLDTST